MKTQLRGHAAAVAEYQCPGCMKGRDPKSCPNVNIDASGCSAQAAGTGLLGAGSLALGLPRGFCRFGPSERRRIDVFTSWPEMIAAHPNLSTIFSVPVWKHLDAKGNTVVRWFSPRTNTGWSTVILGDCRHEMPQALEITAAQIDEMH